MNLKYLTWKIIRWEFLQANPILRHGQVPQILACCSQISPFNNGSRIEAVNTWINLSRFLIFIKLQRRNLALYLWQQRPHYPYDTRLFVIRVHFIVVSFLTWTATRLTFSRGKLRHGFLPSARKYKLSARGREHSRILERYRCVSGMLAFSNNWKTSSDRDGHTDNPSYRD